MLPCMMLSICNRRNKPYTSPELSEHYLKCAKQPITNTRELINQSVVQSAIMRAPILQTGDFLSDLCYHQ